MGASLEDTQIPVTLKPVVFAVVVVVVVAWANTVVHLLVEVDAVDDPDVGLAIFLE